MAETTWIGRSLNKRYRIESLLGQGGMSAVYKATDPNLRRTVAIKLIHPHLASDTNFLQRFEEEAAVVASLRHPNIVQVFDFNSDEETHYMVLEFVTGETLEYRLEHLSQLGEKLPFDEAIRYTLNICDALGYAHQHGMIHRDIKPANIMLNAEGQAILMDFGIVKIMGGTSHTLTGTIFGTANYIPPEIVKGEPADQRSDIYSLGITLYEMLSGDVPFHSDSTMSLMMMHLNNPVPDPRLTRPDLPPALVEILYKCLEKDRDKRYQNADELIADLKRALAMMDATSSEKTVAIYSPKLEGTHPTPAIQPAPIFKKQTIRPLTWFWGAGLLILIFLLLVEGALFFGRNQAKPAATPTTQATATVIPTQPSKPTAGSTALPDEKSDYAPASTSIPGMTASATHDPNITPSPSSFSVKITSISKVGSKYAVQYDVTGFEPKLPGGLHMHFYFNNVAPEDAGMPGTGPWKMYGGAAPFTGYSISQRPEGVTQICVIVANSDHTVIQGTGNCIDLP